MGQTPDCWGTTEQSGLWWIKGSDPSSERPKERTTMQDQSYAYAYHDAPPTQYPSDGWKRLEIHEFSELDPILRRLNLEMKVLGYPRKDTFAVGLVLLEAVRNAIRH